MTRSLPLTTWQRPDDIVALRPSGPVTLSRFLADVRQLAASMPAGRAVLNVCEDRYRFMTGFAAAAVSGRTSLLPSSHTPETVRQLKVHAADLFCLHDGKGEAIDLPGLRFPDTAPEDTGPFAIPAIDEGQVVACLFTSGSTGLPMPHRRTWGSVVRNGIAGAERLGFASRGVAIVGTVPAQHSYGFESTVLLGLFGRCAAWSGRPFYPADIAAALAAVPRPRMLVTTPFHLRALLDAGVDVPPADLLLSATAPLSQALADEAEARLKAPLIEIYGCTESGQLATRRTRDTAAWQPLPGIRLDQEDGRTFASGAYVEGRVPLSDIIEPVADGRFLLHGRHADMVNIAGKRTSIAYLNHQLAAIDGVEDGCFLLPDGDDRGADITRLCAFVVAPALAPAAIVEALRARVDPVFLPRPLILLDRLPRNATGKLPRTELLALLDRHRKDAA